VPGKTLTVSDLAKGVIANDTNIFGVQVSTPPTSGTLTLNTNGTFTYVPNSSWSPDSFVYCGNGATTGPACATVTLAAATIEAGSGITMGNITYTSTIGATSSHPAHFKINPPGILSVDSDGAGYPLTVVTANANTALNPTPSAGLTLSVDPTGGFNASVTASGTYTFTYHAQNSQNTVSAGTGTVTLVFPAGNGPAVTVLDGADKTTQITDYRWIIEEDRTFYVDPKCTSNPLPSTCPGISSTVTTPLVFGTNFHTSHMPVVATGCTGSVSCEGGQTQLGSPVVCDVGNGDCRPDTGGTGQTPVDPSQVSLDPTKRYYISILPGDAANPFNAGYAGAPDCSTAGVAAGSCGHGMGGAPIAAPCALNVTGCTSPFAAVTVLTVPTPNPPAKLTVFVFEDDWPLNGEHDAGGGIDVLSPQEPGLGSFQITLFDDAGGTGDATGQPTYDMFNMPLTNSLAGTIDPITLLDACPLSSQVTANTTTGDGSQKGIIGMIVTCPTFESDGITMSPLAGQAIVNNLYQGRYGVMATPAADRIARGEEWLQTNTLDGQKAHDSFMRIGEPAYFQEFGPAGYHVTIGFANPKIINDRRTNSLQSGLCDPTPAGGGLSCTNEVKGNITTARMSRPPDERLYGSGSRDSFAFTQCYVSLGDPDGSDFAFAKCDDQGNYDLTGLPAGNWKLTIFDQWNDQIVDGISAAVGLACTSTTPGACQSGASSNVTLNLGEIAAHQWQANIYTRTFIDNYNNVHDGVSNKDGNGNDLEGGLPLVATNIRFRDGSFSNFNNTDLNGYAGFNEVFPLFNWYVIETDSTRYKTTGVHVVYDAGGPTDTTCSANTAPCGSSAIAAHFANSYEANPLPANLSVPGAVYCAEGADCGTSAASFAAGTPIQSSTSNHSTGRIDPPFWFGSYGWQGFSGQNSFLEFGKAPYADGENGGIHGHVIYASTRPFDDPRLLLQTSWMPMVPRVRVNLYKEGTAADGTQSLTLVDFTDTSSFDDWAQGFRSDGIPNMNCPGQSNTDLFFFGLSGQPNYLDWYNSQHGGPAPTALPNNSQFKCYDGMHNWNQLEPAPYDGMYAFPSVIGFNPATGKPSGTNCTGCTTNPDASDHYRFGAPMLPAGKYVVEVVVPPGFELVKEEDKNILIGDNYIAPVTQQFAGLGNIYILPDQAAIGSTFNSYNGQNATTDLGRTTLPSTEADTGSVEQFWPCVGAERVVPDFLSIFPQAQEVSPFAGASRNLCDRKEVTLDNQMGALAKFYIFTSTHAASHFTGVITDDFTAEFDPFSPQFGEKFAPAYLPVSVKDWSGNEISRVYSDQFGAYNGLSYSTWEVNPPNPTGYGPTMMVTCMNDPGTPSTPDALYQPNYSNFCYELPFMPGQTGYFDTPVVPTSSFSEGYNHPDCNYPDATPAIASVISSDIAGPWVSAVGHTLTITALGDTTGSQLVDNYGYSGPQATAAPFNQQKVNRHYGFGSAQGTVTIAGQTATISSWSDNQIQVSVPTIPAAASTCSVQQQIQYQGSTPVAQRTTRCGELLITNANGQQSIDTVTVTVGGKTPTLLTSGTIQSALDAAAPGDMIIVPPGVYNEMLIMWKPVRLQGVGAASSIVNGNAHPAGKLEPWRQEIVCLFGLTIDGRPSSGPYAGCPGAGWTNLPAPTASFPTMIVDRVTLEAVLGWDASLNGNLAEQLIEPSLMGAFEGAGITVLGKGVNIPSTATDPFGSVAATVGSFPAGTVLLTTADCGANTATARNPYPSNFYCNPSSLDGLTVKNSSQGGGGIFVHGWGHNIQIANNRVHNNQGTLSGGITIGQGEHVDAQLAGALLLDPPASCETSTIANQSLPFCYNTHVNVHNNSVTLNSSLGDELFSSTPAGAGGVTFCNGADYYRFNNNWVCGNMSTGDGGGVAHIGFTKNGDIEHNSILFNQSTNPTITTNGGGLLVMGAPDLDPTCGVNTDKDCVPDPASVTPSDGAGPGLVINANLILGNAADSGSGGGLRLQHINGTDVVNFPSGSTSCTNVATGNCLWNSINITNNIIVNNVAGWDGAGVSLLDALAVNLVNNTISSNDSTATSGVLFNSLFAPLASAPGTNCTTNNGSQSCPQVAGVVSDTNSPIFKANAATTGFTCPSGHGSGTGATATCRNYSDPLLANDLIWQNRSFFIGVGNFGNGNQNQQKVVTLYNSFGGTTPGSQTATGVCPATGSAYWEVGVRGDSGPTNHVVGSLHPTYTVLTDAADYSGAHNSGGNPMLLSQYCNGSRVPPENGDLGWQVPPGTNETNGLPNPVFSLTPSATVDEGNNWINLRWGPLSLTNPALSGGAYGNFGGGAPLGNYGPGSGSSVVNLVPSTANTYAAAPSLDFFGNPRKTNSSVDAGAIEFQGSTAPPTITSISPNTGYRGTSESVTITGTNLAGASQVTISGTGVTANIVSTTSTTITATFTITATAALTSRNVTVVAPGGTITDNGAFTVLAPSATTITPNPLLRSTTPTTVTITGADLLGATAVTFSGTLVTCTTPTSTGTVAASTVTTNCTSSATAAAGARTVTVVTPNGNATVSETISVPTLTSANPASGLRGSTNMPVTLSGTNLAGATSILVSGTGVTCSITTPAPTASTVNALCTITTAAAETTRTVTVVTATNGNSTTTNFTVQGPTLTSITPNAATHPASGTLAVPVTLTGTNLGTATGLTGLGGGVTLAAGSFHVVNPTTVTATLNVSSTATIGAHNIGVATSTMGNSNTLPFTVN
jgi:hypothetical protein